MPEDIFNKTHRSWNVATERIETGMIKPANKLRSLVWVEKPKTSVVTGGRECSVKSLTRGEAGDNVDMTLRSIDKKVKTRQDALLSVRSAILLTSIFSFESMY